MRKYLPWTLAIALLAVFALPQTCLACSCAVMEAPTTALTRAHAVFRGRAIDISSEQDWSRGSISHYQRVTFRVDESWEGPTTHELVVFTSLGSSTCGYRFVQGEDYLVYATANSGPSRLPAGLGTGICTRTRPLNGAADDLSALGPGTPVAAPLPERLPNVGEGGWRLLPLLAAGATVFALAAVFAMRRGRGRREL